MTPCTRGAFGLARGRSFSLRRPTFLGVAQYRCHRPNRPKSLRPPVTPKSENTFPLLKDHISGIGNHIAEAPIRPDFSFRGSGRTDLRIPFSGVGDHFARGPTQVNFSIGGITLHRREDHISGVRKHIIGSQLLGGLPRREGLPEGLSQLVSA